IGDKYKQNPFEKGTLFLFCGKRSDRRKGLYCGWKRDSCSFISGLRTGGMSWLRNTEEAVALTEEQYRYLMLGLNPLDPKIKNVDPEKVY
ncbi:MAG: IS66 family insertion sequence element accessory protein TnpB, partial [Acetatifactor sp.]|nr:IS66 family insertion sequence element accessory protein TnpB [Acetatifactor sp.]